MEKIHYLTLYTWHELGGRGGGKRSFRRNMKGVCGIIRYSQRSRERKYAGHFDEADIWFVVRDFRTFLNTPALWRRNLWILLVVQTTKLQLNLSEYISMVGDVLKGLSHQFETG
jgi:hypothetical protein